MKKKLGGRIGRKFGGANPRKSNVEKIKETFGPKKKVPSKLKGFQNYQKKFNKNEQETS